MPEPAVGPLLDDAALARRSSLPTKLAPVTLEGAIVRLVPLDLERHLAPLHARSNGQPARLGNREIPAYDPEAIIWRYMSGGPFDRPEDLAAWLRRQVEAPNG